MTKIVVFGASILYGIGDTKGGSITRLKTKINTNLFSKSSKNELIEVYNFSKPGATVEFANSISNFAIKNYTNDKDTSIAIISIGMNNAKAVNSRKNYVSTIDDYKKVMGEFLGNVVSKVNHTICIGYTPVDERKTTPKVNPLNNTFSYFTNERILLFNNEFEKICNNLNVKFINFFEKLDLKDWKDSCLYTDGIHPNDKGHEIIFDNILNLYNSITH